MENFFFFAFRIRIFGFGYSGAPVTWYTFSLENSILDNFENIYFDFSKFLF